MINVKRIEQVQFLQEVNAFAIVDLTASPPHIKEIHHLGFKDGLLPGNELDASDLDGLDPSALAETALHGRPRLANCESSRPSM